MTDEFKTKLKELSEIILPKEIKEWLNWYIKLADFVKEQEKLLDKNVMFAKVKDKSRLEFITKFSEIENDRIKIKNALR